MLTKRAIHRSLLLSEERYMKSGLVWHKVTELKQPMRNDLVCDTSLLMSKKQTFIKLSLYWHKATMGGHKLSKHMPYFFSTSEIWFLLDFSVLSGSFWERIAAVFL